MIDKITRENAVNDVKDGMSYLQAAKLHDISYEAVRQWCYDAHVQSLQASEWKTDKEIIKTIILHKAITCYALAKTLGYTNSALNKRLRRIIQDGKIQSFRIPPHSHNAHIHRVFTKYVNTRVYYLSKDDLVEWVRSQLPEEPSMSLRMSVTRMFRSVGKIFKEG